MIWPNATDYNAAVQNPQLCFRDDDLRRGQAVGDLFGLPRPHSGNFADVYQIQGADGQSWAVKCFTRPVTGLRTRYHAISEHLRHAQRAFMVEFHFLDESICVRGQWHPLVKMRWIEGLRLNEFICEHLNKPALLDRLAQLWVRLAQELRDAGMAHGDLQHGNVLLVPGSKGSSLSLKLIDYDGMYVPALADRPSGEAGHPHYQHPRRLREGGYGRDMDRFSHLLIYTALRCLRHGGEELWQRYDNQENLLFREDDFRQPSQSRLLHELWEMTDRETHNLVGHLLLASQRPLEIVPTLDELVDDSGLRPLSDSEEMRIKEILEGNISHPSRDRKGATPPPLPHGRGAAMSASIAAPAVDATDLTETRPISRGVKTAEIDLGDQAPAHVDPLVSKLSHPAWLAALSVIAMVSFLVINVMVWSSITEPATTDVVTNTKPQIQEDISLKRTQEDASPQHKQAENAVPKPKQAEQTTPKQKNISPPRKQENDPTPKQEKSNPKPKQEDANPKPKQGERKPLLVGRPSGRQEAIHFPTVDHMSLAGTLYHGWKGKEGMTVLMLHDLGSHRNTLGWKRLAEALQTEGHTVLTFDFRGHGDSKKVSPQFWKYPVNKSLPTYVSILPTKEQPKVLEETDLPTAYRPWLTEDIAAARTFLDLRHDDPSGPVNTFNLVVLGAGQAAALGSLWLATEGLRYNGSDTGNQIQLKWPEKLSILQAVWLGMADPLKFNPFGIHSWLEGAHAKPVVPITFIYGEDDIDTSTLLSKPLREKCGDKFVISGARRSGQDLLDAEPQAAARIQQYLVKTLRSLAPVGWVPRKIKTLHSFWRMKLSGERKAVRWYEAKRVGGEMLSPVPFQHLGIPIKGLAEPKFLPGEAEP
jgi:pimeloyl-ACP methyl ester carboxylesterase